MESAQARSDFFLREEDHRSGRYVLPAVDQRSREPLVMPDDKPAIVTGDNGTTMTVDFSRVTVEMARAADEEAQRAVADDRTQHREARRSAAYFEALRRMLEQPMPPPPLQPQPQPAPAAYQPQPAAHQQPQLVGGVSPDVLRNLLGGAPLPGRPAASAFGEPSYRVAFCRSDGEQHVCSFHALSIGSCLLSLARARSYNGYLYVPPLGQSILVVIDGHDYGLICTLIEKDTEMLGCTIYSFSVEKQVPKSALTGAGEP